MFIANTHILIKEYTFNHIIDMKYHNYILFILISGLLVLASCEEEIIDDPNIDEREKFLGDWETTETSTLEPNSFTFNMVIEPDVNSSQIRLYNIYYLGLDVYANALVTGSSFTIPQQNVNNMIIEGYGEMITETRIEMEYTVNDGADLNNVTGVMIKAVPSLPPPLLALN